MVSASPKSIASKLFIFIESVSVNDVVLVFLLLTLNTFHNFV